MIPNYTDYQKYINSFEWRVRRSAFIRSLWMKRCSICHKELGRFTHVHHLSYDRLGCEKDSDLQALCVDCHYEVEAAKGNDFWKQFRAFANTKEIPRFLSEEELQRKAQIQKTALNKHIREGKLGA